MLLFDSKEGELNCCLILVSVCKRSIHWNIFSSSDNMTHVWLLHKFHICILNHFSKFSKLTEENCLVDEAEMTINFILDGICSHSVPLLEKINWISYLHLNFQEIIYQRKIHHKSWTSWLRIGEVTTSNSNHLSNKVYSSQNSLHPVPLVHLSSSHIMPALMIF